MTLSCGLTFIQVVFLYKCLPTRREVGCVGMATPKALADELLSEGFSAGRQRLKDVISVLRSAGMETIEDFDGLPDFKYIKGLGHLLPDDALFLEGVCARINNPVRLLDSDFIAYIAWLRWCDLLAGT